MVQRDFQHVATDKGIGLNVEVDPKIPEFIITDEHRISQIIRNLMSNAIKFTAKGSVTFSIKNAPLDLNVSSLLPPLEQCVALSVTDTGIGIPEEKQAMVFESFQQADGTTSREYGGTGLGLAISQQLAQLLGGEIVLISELNKGKSFILVLPIVEDNKPTGSKEIVLELPKETKTTEPEIEFKATTPSSSENKEESREIKQEPANLLIIDLGDEVATELNSVQNFTDLKVIQKEDFFEVYKVLNQNHIQCIIVNLRHPNLETKQLISALQQVNLEQRPPVIVYTDTHFSQEDSTALKGYIHSVIIKGSASKERLINETKSILSEGFIDVPIIKNQLSSTQAEAKKSVLNGKKVLIVDDDMRNTFAISKILRGQGMQVIMAANGKTALDTLSNQDNVDAILMDIMMPIMDGYEAMKRIRDNQAFQELPIIALTAKAMVGDKEKCLQAGATDFLSKPLDPDLLVETLAKWLNHGK